VELFSSRKKKAFSPADINLKSYAITKDIISISSISVLNGIDIMGCRHYWKTKVDHFVKTNGQLRFLEPAHLRLNSKKNRCFREIAFSWWVNILFISSLEKGYFSKITTLSKFDERFLESRNSKSPLIFSNDWLQFSIKRNALILYSYYYGSKNHWNHLKSWNHEISVFPLDYPRLSRQWNNNCIQLII